MKKIFIVLFILLASSVYAEIETIFDYSYYTKEGEKETISLEVFEDEDEEEENKYLLRVFHYGENFQIVYGIFTKDEEKLEELIANLLLYKPYSNFILCLTEHEHFEENKRYKLKRRTVCIISGSVYTSYSYDYN